MLSRDEISRTFKYFTGDDCYYLLHIPKKTFQLLRVYLVNIFIRVQTRPLQYLGIRSLLS